MDDGPAHRGLRRRPPLTDRASLSRAAPDPFRAGLVLVQLWDIRVAQRAQGADCRDAGGEAVAAEQVQVAVLERGEPGDVLVPDLVALDFQLGDGGVDVAGCPERDGVEDQAERAELVLRAVAVRLVDGAALAVAHVPRQLVAGLLYGRLPVHLASVGVVHRVDDPQQVDNRCTDVPRGRTREVAATFLGRCWPALLGLGAADAAAGVPMAERLWVWPTGRCCGGAVARPAGRLARGCLPARRRRRGHGGRSQRWRRMSAGVLATFALRRALSPPLSSSGSCKRAAGLRARHDCVPLSNG